MKRLAICHTCRLKHLAAEGSDEAIEFFDRHRGHIIQETKPDAQTILLADKFGVDLFRERRNSLSEKLGIQNIKWPWQKRDNERTIEFDRLGFAGYRDNASIKQAFGGEVSMDLTSLNSLAGSATAGWQSAYVDNTSNLYLDALFYAKFGTGGTVGGSLQAMWFLYGASNTTDFPVTGAATGGTTGASSSAGGALTFLDVTANLCVLPLIAVFPTRTSSIPYVFPATSLMAQLQGPLMPYWGLAFVNEMNWTIAASGNLVKYDPVYYTVI